MNPVLIRQRSTKLQICPRDFNTPVRESEKNINVIEFIVLKLK